MKQTDIRGVMDFLRRLKANNNREWFAAHKEEWLEARKSVERLTSELIARVSAFDPEARFLQPSDCTYRIYRDTRFSPDKTPYKTHAGIYICPPYGKNSQRGGYYLHLEPGECFVAVGAWCPPKEALQSIRNEIAADPEEYLGIIKNPRFTRFYDSVGEDLLKTAPKGFDKDWEYIALVRPRSYTAMSRLEASDLGPGVLVERVAERMEAGYEFVRFLNYAIDASKNL